jgi:hypothetical protein
LLQGFILIQNNEVQKACESYHELNQNFKRQKIVFLKTRFFYIVLEHPLKLQTLSQFSTIFSLLFKAISKQLNFTIELTVMDEEKWGVLYSNGTATGAMAKVINKEVDLTIGKFTITESRMKFMSATFSYYSSPLIVMVPRGKDVTPIERLMKPFQETVWVLVVLVFAVAFLAIGFLKIKGDEGQRDFVFGSRNRAPTLNLFVSFIGGSLVRLPTRNFARTLLCIFLLYSLIVRNSYTGALFNFIKRSNVRRPPFDSIDAMVEENFTFYMVKSAQELTKEVKKVYDRRHLMDPLEVPKYRSKLIDSSFRGGCRFK